MKIVLQIVVLSFVAVATCAIGELDCAREGVSYPHNTWTVFAGPGPELEECLCYGGEWQGCQIFLFG